MSFARGKYGVEYDPRHFEESRHRPFSLVAVVWVVIALVLVTVLLVWRSHIRREADDREAALIIEAVDGQAAKTRPAPSAPTAAPQAPPPGVSTAPPVVDSAAVVRRTPQVRNLLLRLDAANRAHDIEMAATTIEQIRALPGSPAADLDDALARRLGKLNLRRLFERKSALWVTDVTVRRGDAAQRIAREHGSTFASLEKLNGGKLDRLAIGTKLKVMEHPRFSLVVHRRTRTADLSLNGKFFKRYDLTADVTGAVGAYELPERPRPFWTERGISVSAADRAELELLMPAGSAVVVAEL